MSSLLVATLIVGPVLLLCGEWLLDEYAARFFRRWGTLTVLLGAVAQSVGWGAHIRGWTMVLAVIGGTVILGVTTYTSRRAYLAVRLKRAKIKREKLDDATEVAWRNALASMDYDVIRAGMGASLEEMARRNPDDGLDEANASGRRRFKAALDEEFLIRAFEQEQLRDPLRRKSSD